MRAIGTNFEKSKSKCFRRWRNAVLSTQNLHPSLSQLRLTVLKLQAELETVSNSDKTAALLAAERALNK